MLTKAMLSRFKDVTSIDAIPGIENDLMIYLEQKFRAYGYEIVRDNLGSLFALKRSQTKDAYRVLVASHADEVGLTVQKINNNGIINVSARGGIDPLVLLAQRATLTTKEGVKLQGAVDSLPPHLSSQGTNNLKIERLNFDFGFRNAEEVRAAGVNIGDMIVINGEFIELNDGKRLLSKAFDNRYGVFMALEVAEYFKDHVLPYDLYIGATVQEEVGLRGATTISNVIAPHFAIVLDCSPARDTVGGSEGGALGKGILLRYFDRSMIANQTLLTFQEETAAELKVPTQYYMSLGGTDAGAIHLSHHGVTTLTHCICARGLHTNSTIIDAEDVIWARKVLLRMLEKLTPTEIKRLKESKHG